MRLTSRSSRSLDLARLEALGLGAVEIGTAHLLLGLAREGRENGDPLLADVDPDRVRGLLPMRGGDVGSPPLSPCAAASLAVAARHAAGGRVDVTHLLAAVLTYPSSTAIGVLERLGVDAGHLWVRATAAVPEPTPLLVRR
ncbi:Clp protease N-terminal domain-containing protein [Actinomycetospora termitidis]|uniref:Clp protease N-terminal domain-containing protein n=1 Tax=Actinomycetospora termitidis TaxID=3053470 RepID=A0ABT7M3X5_9PSEU|nr:Clp protease N-terminal domain-containing protein [Actinomycetospora sp. Odt1-22]MDL5155377.1 Clp protease N-terminal domain-containing protein [Actinomycetospora sp. Odt1-22]